MKQKDKQKKRKVICPICGKEYVNIQRHINLKHPQLPGFRKRLFFYLHGLKHIGIIQGSFIFIYLLPYSRDFYGTVLEAVLGFFFIFYYIFRGMKMLDDTTNEQMLAFRVPGIMVFSVFTMIMEMGASGAYEFLAELFIAWMKSSGSQFHLTGKGLFRAIMSFIVPLSWILTAILWELYLFIRKKYHS